MTKIFAIRAEPGLSATIETGMGIELDIAGYPLSRVEAVHWDVPSTDRFDALLVGSANSFRFGGNSLAKLQRLPVFAVGEVTANMARTHGFTVEKTGEGGLQSLLDSLPDTPLRLLRLTGERNVALDPAPHIRISDRVVYRTVELSIPKDFASALSNKSLILLYSAGSAEHFAAECDRLNIARDTISLAALGPRILAAAGDGWAEARSAVNPTETALLALAHEMCN